MELIKEKKYQKSLLNTPGIGKTKTIEHFGNALMEQRPFKHSKSEETSLCIYAQYSQTASPIWKEILSQRSP